VYITQVEWVVATQYKTITTLNVDVMELIVSRISISQLTAVLSHIQQQASTSVWVTVK
jgi:uncharacterized coiled-coil protein SlyX